MWTEDKWQTMLRQQWQCQQAVDRYNESQRKRVRPMSEWGIVDLFGRQTLAGRVSEVERFGVKMLAIEVLFNGALLPVAYFGGAAIYGFVPCSEDVARKRGATARYDLTPSIAATAPLTALDPPPGFESVSIGSGTNDYPGESKEAPDEGVRARLREPYYAELRRQSEEDDILF